MCVSAYECTRVSACVSMCVCKMVCVWIKLDTCVYTCTDTSPPPPPPVQYLQGQFYRHQAYREDDHWKRLWKLGSGGQATCYSIVDKQTNSLLALKEVGKISRRPARLVVGLPD